MKKTILSLLAIGALGLASCSSDDIKVNNPGDGAEGVGVGYMGFTINTDASRAYDDDWSYDDPNNDEVFNPGTVDEYAMAPHAEAHLVIFFSEGDKYYGSSYLTPYGKDNDSDFADDHVSGSDHTAEYPEQFYTYITRWRNADQRFLPKKALVIINGNPTTLNALKDDLEGRPAEAAATLEDVMGTVNYDCGLFNMAGTTYFTMSNSVFAGTEGMVDATPLDGKIYKTAEEALANRVTVYVERLLAKHTLTYTSEGKEQYVGDGKEGGVVMYPKTEVELVKAVTSYTGEEEDLDWPETKDVKWAALIDGWNMNGLEQNEYMFKKMENTDYFNGIGKLNNAALHRSYWGESANYNKGLYPTQYRRYDLEPETFKPEENYNFFDSAIDEFDQPRDYTLRYISYNEIFDLKVYTKEKDSEDSNYELPILSDHSNDRYTVERTYDPTLLEYNGDKGYAPYRMATHFLLGAKLQIGEEVGGTTASEKYYAYNWYWTGENCKEDYIRYSYRRVASFMADGLDHVIKGVTYTLADNKTFYVKDGEEYKAVDVKDATTYFDTEAASLYHGDGKVVLSPKKTFTFYVKTTEDKYVGVPRAELVNFIYANTDAARHFSGGAMYYAIPVQHMHGRSNMGDNKYRVAVNKYAGYETDDKRDTSDAYTTGQFGVVRNHWYRLNITAINSVGIPVDDPDQPIIPDPEDEWAVAFEIVVLPWHVIDMGGVEL